MLIRKKAFKLYQKASELENSVAQLSLAKMYVDGDGIDKDHNKAFALSKKLAKKYYPSGINLLGCCYHVGIGTDINVPKAFILYQKATDLGNDFAQYNLALMYENGIVVKKDIDQAIYWYKNLLYKEIKMLKVN